MSAPPTGFTTANLSKYHPGVGMSAASLAKTNSGQNTNPRLVYNGFAFPPHSKIRISQVPEYDKTRRTVKYVTIAISVEAVITTYTIPLRDATETNSERLNLSQYPTQDVDMQELRHRLSQPCRSLEFTLAGCGNIRVNTTSGVADVDFGPKPQVIDWQPLGGGLASVVQWLVVTRVPITAVAGADQLGGYAEQSPLTLNNSGLGPLLEHQYTISYSYDSLNLLTRSIQGSIELPMTRYDGGDPNSPSTEIREGVRKNMNTLIAGVRRYFLGQEDVYQEKTEDFSVSEDDKVFKYSIVDKVVSTFQSYPVGLSSQTQLRESVSTNLSEGLFTYWTWKMSGTLVVPSPGYEGLAAGVNMPLLKKVAMNQFFEFMYDRLRKAATRGNSVIHYNKKGELFYSPEQLSGNEIVPLYEVKSFYMPTGASIDNDLFGNAINVEFTFMLTTASSLLFQVTGMFENVEGSGEEGDNWRTYPEWDFWRKQTGTGSSLLKLTNLDSDGTEYVVDFSHPLQMPNPSFQNRPDPPESSVVDAPFVEPPYETRDSGDRGYWIKYHNSFVFHTKYGTTVVKSTNPGTPESVEEDNLPTPGEGAENKTGQDTSYQYQTVADNATDEICYVTMVGYAVRYKYPIKAPTLKSVAGIPAKKYGTDKIVGNSESTGIPSTRRKGEKPPSEGYNSIYVLSWKKTYVLNKTPANFGKIESTGFQQKHTL